MHQESFCLLKSEAYLFKKAGFIESKIRSSGLNIVDQWSVKLSFWDTFAMYPGWVPRLTMSLRFSPFFKLDMFLLEGDDAIRRMYQLKHQIRQEIWGREFKKGGFLHAPDSVEEDREHKAILYRRKIYTDTIATKDM